MALGLISEESSVASAGLDELKTVDLQKYAKNLKRVKIKKDLVSAPSMKPFLLIIQDLTKIKKIRTTFCRHC